MMELKNEFNKVLSWLEQRMAEEPVWGGIFLEPIQRFGLYM